MPEGFELLSYGFRVDTDVAAVGEIVERTFGAFRSAVDAGAPTYEIRRGTGDRDARLLVDGESLLEASLDRVVDHLLWHVHSRAYGRSTDLLLVHAGVVAHHGLVILLPAASGSGKTTLTAGLVAAGLDYLSDEVAAIEPDSARVVPVPAALSVKEGSLPTLHSLMSDDLSPEAASLLPDGRPVPARALRRDPLGGSGQAGLVVTPRYEAGSTTRLRPCSRATGLFDLASNGFNLEVFGVRGFELLARVVRPTRCFRLRIGDLDSAVTAVLEALEAADDAGDPA